MSSEKGHRRRLVNVAFSAYDLYAAAALVATARQFPQYLSDPRTLATEAFEIADAMMLERLPSPIPPKEPNK